MMKNRIEGGPREIGDVVSIIGPGMRIVGDCSSDGTIRVEGRVEGSVAAAKSVVVGKEGEVVGDIRTQDAIIAGSVTGSVAAESRIELQATCRIKGDIQSRRVKLDEGGQVDGKFHMGVRAGDSGKARHKSEDRTPKTELPAAVAAAAE